MGKYALLVTLSALAGVTMLMYQSDRTAVKTSQRQAVRQAKVIARQIARSGYNAVRAEARVENHAGKTVDGIVDAVGTKSGNYEDGTYEAWVKKISPTAYSVVSVGTYTVYYEGREIPVRDTIGEAYAENTVPLEDTPVVEDPSTLNVSFIESMAGYCSAIYLKRILPDVKPENQPEPELIFAPGNNRNDASTTYERTIVPGTKLNFILAVHADSENYSCPLRGDTTLTVNDGFYDYSRESFNQDVSDIETVHEAPYALIQEHSTGGWRVAFEDLVFDEKKLWDVKENGYPDSDNAGEWNSNNDTYGGDGWDTDANGLYDLEDYGSVPDFSDQVIDVNVVPDDSDGPEPTTYVEAARSHGVTVSSTKDLSNVIWERQDGSWEKKEGLSGHTLTLPNSSDNPITDVWVKSGPNFTDPSDPQAPTSGAGEYHPVTLTN